MSESGNKEKSETSQESEKNNNIPSQEQQQKQQPETNNSNNTNNSSENNKVVVTASDQTNTNINMKEKEKEKELVPITFSLPMSTSNFLIVSACSIFATFTMMQQVRAYPENLTQSTELSSGQVMAFLVIFGTIFTFFGVHFFAMKEYYSSSSSGKNFSAVEQTNHSSSSNPHSYSTSLRRVITDEQYAALHAGTEFVSCLLLFFFCDRTKMIVKSGKHYDRDTFWFLVAILFLAGLATLKRVLRPQPKPSSSTTSAVTPSSSSTTTVATNNSTNASTNENTSTSAAENNSNTSNNAATTASSSSSTNAVNIPSSSTVSIDTTITTIEDGNYHVGHLQRDQTEEWKGWMQVLFLWYHYFNAKEIYNLIRLFIAAYVWMTGFGNFSYYYIRKDFCLLRFCSMQWRLNFLVFWVCLLMQNEYMLYYICMLHTTFTVFIYAGLGIYSSVNQTFIGCCSKFAVLTIAALFVWDISTTVFEYCWWPFTPIVKFTNPYKPSENPMYEWQFRSHLDHLVWIFGMFCAFNHPTWDSWLRRIDALPAATGGLIKGAVVAVCCTALYYYNEKVFSLPKKEYNKLHPYTSFIPIFIYIILRNIFQFARQYHMHLFEWLGKITLETYITQYHVWMATTGINGSPKKLLAFLGKDYPLLNFTIASGLALVVSHRLFGATNSLKSYFLPSSLQSEQLKKVLLVYGVVLAGLYFTGMSLVVMTGGGGNSSSNSASSATTTGGASSDVKN